MSQQQQNEINELRQRIESLELLVKELFAKSPQQIKMMNEIAKTLTLPEKKRANA